MRKVKINKEIFVFDSPINYIENINLICPLLLLKNNKLFEFYLNPSGYYTCQLPEKRTKIEMEIELNNFKFKGEWQREGNIFDLKSFGVDFKREKLYCNQIPKEITFFSQENESCHKALFYYQQYLVPALDNIFYISPYLQPPANSYTSTGIKPKYVGKHLEFLPDILYFLRKERNFRDFLKNWGFWVSIRDFEVLFEIKVNKKPFSAINIHDYYLLAVLTQIFIANKDSLIILDSPYFLFGKEISLLGENLIDKKLLISGLKRR